MAGTVHTQTISREQLLRALEDMQARAGWTPEQAEALLEELDRVGAPAPVPVAPPPRGGEAPLRSRLAEAAAYAGAVLVAAAGVVLVGQQWEELGRPGRIAVLGGVTAVLAVVGLAVALWPPGGRPMLRLSAHAVRRRLASSTLTLATATAAGTAAVVFVDHGLLAAAITAVPAAAVIQWAAPSAVSEIAGLAAVAMLAGAVLDETGATSAAAVVTLGAVGLGWALLSRTRVLTLPTLGLALGLLLTLWTGISGAFAVGDGDSAAGIAVLAVLAVAGLGGYVYGGHWPLAAAGVMALAALVLRVSTDRLGPVLGLLFAGLVLLGASALVFFWRRPSSTDVTRRGGRSG